MPAKPEDCDFSHAEQHVAATMTYQQKARMEGAAAAIAGLKLDANTYPEDSDSHFEWLSGWTSTRLELLQRKQRKAPPPEPEGELPAQGCKTCGRPTDYVYCSEGCTPDCKHGNRPGECDKCDAEADQAYDAWKERH